MKNVTILALRHASVTTIMGPMECFHFAGLLWNVVHGQNPSPYFSAKIASLDGKPVTCLNRVVIQPHCALHEIEKTDLVIICAITGDMERAVQANLAVIPWLINQHATGTQIASICTGAFLLAETGLLDGKTATTHWGFAEQFRARYPRVKLLADRLYTDEGDLFCSGGSQAGFDLVLHLIEKLCGRAVAVQTAKVMVQDIGRASQMPYAGLVLRKDHTDQTIMKAQQWLEDHHAEKISIAEVGTTFGMSTRTFERRFKQATGVTPLVYLQNVRLEAAKRIMETEHATFDEITYRVAYQDSTSFRKIFQRHAGLSPKEYRRLFHKLT